MDGIFSVGKFVRGIEEGEAQARITACGPGAQQCCARTRDAIDGAVRMDRGVPRKGDDETMS